MDSTVLTDAQEVLALWLACEPEKRSPKHQTDLAAMLGVTDQKISEWKSLAKVKARVYTILRSELEDSVGPVLREIARRARAGEVAFVDRYLSLIGASSVVAGANATSHITMSDAEALRLVARVTGQGTASMSTASMSTASTDIDGSEHE